MANGASEAHSPATAGKAGNLGICHHLRHQVSGDGDPGKEISPQPDPFVETQDRQAREPMLDGSEGSASGRRCRHKPEPIGQAARENSHRRWWRRPALNTTAVRSSTG